MKTMPRLADTVGQVFDRSCEVSETEYRYLRRCVNPVDNVQDLDAISTLAKIACAIYPNELFSSFGDGVAQAAF